MRVPTNFDQAPQLLHLWEHCVTENLQFLTIFQVRVNDNCHY